MIEVLIDDIGSFPLPDWISREEFDRSYTFVREEISKGAKIEKDLEPFKNFYKAVKTSLDCKVSSGIDIVNYPQHYDMHKQFMGPIIQFQEEPFLIQEKHAIMPELFVAERESKRIFEESGKILQLKVCVTGALELHLKSEFGFYIYEEILNNLAESVNRFLKNAILNTKYVKTAVVAIDEPSLGFVDLFNIEDEAIIKVLARSVKDIPAKVQIHLHTLKSVGLPLQADGIEVITSEFAASPENMNMITKKELEDHDKSIRAGVTRTDYDAILAEHLDKGIEPKH
ncbi:MAG: hypothetical protein ACE5J5_02035, partial [Candidatus Hydrothermarchaeales archaeon]